MRLFSVKEAKQNPATLTDEIRRSFQLEKLIKKNQETANELIARLDPEKQRLEKGFREFSSRIQQQKSALLKEISDLEDRKAKALEPLDAKWYELETREIALTDKQSELGKRQAAIESQKEQINDQLEFIQDKTDELIDREKGILKQEHTAADQKRLLEQSTKELNNKWLSYHQTVKEKTEELSGLAQRLNSESKATAIIKQSLTKQQQDLDIYKRQLDDRAATLERGFAELRIKQQNNG